MMQNPRLRIAMCIAVPAILIGALSSACNDEPPKGAGAAEASPSASATTPEAPAPTATPTAAPADPSLAEELRINGDFEAAIGVYASVAAAADDHSERQNARLSQAQLLSRFARHEEARPVLDAYLADEGAAAAGSDAQFLLASTLDELGEWDDALAAYDTYVTAAGPITEYANVERAKLLARLQRPVEANAAADAILAGGALPSELHASFTVSMGSAHEQGLATTEALACSSAIPHGCRTTRWRSPRTPPAAALPRCSLSSMPRRSP
jgi:hypothetical protein